MKLLPDLTKVARPTKARNTLGRGTDFALVVLLFLGIGYALDRVFDTRPVLMIVCVVLSLVGQSLKMYYEYSAAMEKLEAERAEAQRAVSRGTKAA